MKRAVCILFIRNDQILTVTRRNSNEWGLPGGKIDEGEFEFEAAIRETEEETGLKLKASDLTTLYTGWCPPGREDGLYFWTTTYLVNEDVDISAIKSMEPGIEVVWRPIHEVQSPLNIFKAYNQKAIENYYLSKNPFFSENAPH